MAGGFCASCLRQAQLAPEVSSFLGAGEGLRTPRGYRPGVQVLRVPRHLSGSRRGDEEVCDRSRTGL